MATSAGAVGNRRSFEITKGNHKSDTCCRTEYRIVAQAMRTNGPLAGIVTRNSLRLRWQEHVAAGYTPRGHE